MYEVKFEGTRLTRIEQWAMDAQSRRFTCYTFNLNGHTPLKISTATPPTAKFIAEVWNATSGRDGVHAIATGQNDITMTWSKDLSATITASTWTPSTWDKIVGTVAAAIAAFAVWRSR